MLKDSMQLSAYICGLYGSTAWSGGRSYPGGAGGKGWWLCGGKTHGIYGIPPCQTGGGIPGGPLREGLEAV